MKYLAAVALLLTFTVPAYAQEEPAPADKPEEPAASALKLSEEEITREMAFLGSRFLSDRVRAQKTIARVGKDAIPYLKDALESDNPSLRMNAVALLGRMKRLEAVRTILEMYGDSSPAVRSTAQRALIRYGPEVVAEVDKLIESGQVKEGVLTDALLADLYQKPVIERFKKVVRGGQFPGQYAPVVELGPRAVPALLHLLDCALTPGQAVADQPSAIDLINTLGDFTKDKRITDKLEGLWKIDNQAYRQAVAISLAKLGVDKHLKEMIDAMLETAKGQTNARLFQSIALLYHRTGNYEESEKWFRRGAEATGDNIYYYNLACALAMGKKLDKAVEALKFAVEKGYRNFAWMVKDKELDPIREQPGYIDLLKKHCPDYLPEKLKEKKEEEKQDTPEKPEKDPGSED